MQSNITRASPNIRAAVAVFPHIPHHYFDDILHSRLDVKDIARFTIDPSCMPAAERRDAPVPKNMIELLRGFDVYVYIMLSFTPATVKWELYQVITIYRLRLMAMLDYKIFASIRVYHEHFVARAIILGQYNSSIWTMPFPEAEWTLRSIPREDEEEEEETYEDE